MKTKSVVSAAEGRRRVAQAGAVATESVPFSVIKHAVAKQFELMKQHTLYRVDLSQEHQDAVLSPEQRLAFTGDKLWEGYLTAFPAGTNPIFRERTDHDCSCCRHFIRTMGGVVAIVDGSIVTLWDGLTEGYYIEVSKAMRELVRSAAIDNVFLHAEKQIGTEKNFQQVTNEFNAKTGASATQTIAWEHFHVHLPSSVVVKKDQIGPKQSEARSTFDVFKRGLEELTLDAVDTVLELVAQNSLYRGVEYKGILEAFRAQKAAYLHLPPLGDHGVAVVLPSLARQELFAWSADTTAAVKRIRNTAIGTLLIDLSPSWFDACRLCNDELCMQRDTRHSHDSLSLEDAVKKFETSIMAPTNYKRPTALVSKAMIAKAAAVVEELGYTSALERRYAHIDDVTVNNILFADRTTTKLSKSVFDTLTAGVPENTKKLDKVEEVSIEKFLSDVLPKADSLEILLENRHQSNLVALIAPADPGAKNMFKWPNRFSWSYNGGIADSMRERVRTAGGRVDGILRFTHSWNHPEVGRNGSLMDLHVFMPGSSVHRDGNHDYYPSGPRVGWNRRNDPTSGGVQDVDYTSVAPENCVPIENIALPTLSRLKDGLYVFKIHNWAARNPNNSGFKAEIEFDGQIFHYDHPKPLCNKEWITLAEVTLQNGKLTIEHKHPHGESIQKLWNLTSQTFQKVNAVMLSPNYWDSWPAKDVSPEQVGLGKSHEFRERSGVGNKHWFFMLDGCKNADKARGFLNEFLSAELEPHRKTMEMVSAKMLTENADRQLSGLGFSSTKRDSMLVRVKGKFNRVVKVVF